MKAGRFVCVALPILLTIGAIISYMIATLSGIAHHNLYIFSVDLTNLTLTENTLESIISSLDIDGISLGRRSEETRDLAAPVPIIDTRADDDSVLTASDLGLGRVYEITLWGYCEVKKDSSGSTTNKTCIKGEYNWASKHLQTDLLDDLGSSTGVNITLPTEIDKALDVFSTVTRYTEIAFIIALAVLGLELFLGIFANCTRIISCLVWLIGIAAIVFCVVAAALATAMGAVVVGAVEASAKEYGVTGSLNTNFLATIWIGAAFAIVASLFWLFTICCCKPDHSKRHSKNHDDHEKLVPSRGYYPIDGHNDHEMSNTGYNNQFQPTYGHDYSHAPSAQSGHRSGSAYEPYSHRA